MTDYLSVLSWPLPEQTYDCTSWQLDHRLTGRFELVPLQRCEGYPFWRRLPGKLCRINQRNFGCLYDCGVDRYSRSSG